MDYDVIKEAYKDNPELQLMDAFSNSLSNELLDLIPLS